MGASAAGRVSEGTDEFRIQAHQRPGCGDAADLRAIIDSLTRAMQALDLPAGSEMAVVLGDDAELAGLNARYRGKEGPTDVLSFPVDAGALPEGVEPPLGDVVISVAYAERSAARTGNELREELCLLAVHGLLHLIGYEDETEAGAEAMREIEVELGVRKAG